jgi:hypothetical protein
MTRSESTRKFKRALSALKELQPVSIGIKIKWSGAAGIALLLLNDTKSTGIYYNIY